MRSKLNVISTIAVVILVFTTVCLITPAPVRAGLMRIQLEFEQQESVIGLGYLQFDDIEEGVWVPISDLTNFTYAFSIPIYSQAANGGVFVRTSSSNDGGNSVWYGSIRLTEVATNVFMVSHSNTGLGSPCAYIGQDMDGAGTSLTELHVETYSLPDAPWAGWWAAVTYPYTHHAEGLFCTTVWFDDPPSSVPIPPSALLMVSALMPILALKKWRRF